MKIRFFTPVFFILVSFLLTACAGYKLGADSGTIFGDSSKTIKIKGVDYPTLDVRLPYLIRSQLRDELATRHMVTWVDSGAADYEIQINVKSYTSREWIRSKEDITQLYDTVLTLEAVVYKGSTNHEVWRSGVMSYSERNDDIAAQSGDLLQVILTQLTRQLVDRMYNVF